jgi:type III secretory pathway lipoprotein EscJ
LRALLVLIAACAPEIAGPLEQQRALDRDDATHLAGQLAALPGAVRADVTLHRPASDPLTRATTPASAAIVVVVDDRADRTAVTEAARRLAHATAPEIPDPVIEVELGAVRPQIARVGPFSVDVRDKPALVAVLASAFALIAGLAGWIAWRERYRRGSNPQ